MTNKHEKNFVAMLKDNKDMPKIQIITDEKTIKNYGGNKMFFAPPLYYDELIKQIPEGKLVLLSDLRNFLAKKNNADFTEPMTAGIFVQIVAWASHQRKDNPTPFWRVLKLNGELNPKYPEAITLQKQLLEKEGHKVIAKGKKYYVENYEKSLYKF